MLWTRFRRASCAAAVREKSRRTLTVAESARTRDSWRAMRVGSKPRSPTIVQTGGGQRCDPSVADPPAQRSAQIKRRVADREHRWAAPLRSAPSSRRPTRAAVAASSSGAFTTVSVTAWSRDLAQPLSRTSDHAASPIIPVTTAGGLRHAISFFGPPTRIQNHFARKGDRHSWSADFVDGRPSTQFSWRALSGKQPRDDH
jgi:hypothetical protein